MNGTPSKTIEKDYMMLKGLGNLGDMAKMMKTAQEMQTRLADLQAALATRIVTGESGLGLVRVTATAKGELTGITIDPSIFVPSEKEVAEDLILAAIKDAQTRAAEVTATEMQRLSESLGLPAGMKLPF
jgi:nucleoid-associated protein EbfC